MPADCELNNLFVALITSGETSHPGLHSFAPDNVFGPHLTRALTVERTTLESRNSGVTRMWKSDREAKATAGDRSASSEM